MEGPIEYKKLLIEDEMINNIEEQEIIASKQLPLEKIIESLEENHGKVKDEELFNKKENVD